ncbi:hypothetical protein, partial [Jeotgalibacillus marinus]
FYIFGAFVLLFTSIFYDTDANQFGIAERFGLTNAPEQLVRVLVALISLLMVFGYIRLKKWGFWMMIFYSLFFGIISWSLSLSYNQQPFIGNTVWSIIILVYTIHVRNAFFRRSKQE